jgi:hypothetical protein
MISEPLDVVPIWCFFLAATAIGMLAVEGGYRFGKWRHVKACDEKDGPVGAMVGSILGLLAVMLAAILTLAFAGVLFLIVDLDRAREGSLRVSQQPMIDLLKTMRAVQP